MVRKYRIIAGGKSMGNAIALPNTATVTSHTIETKTPWDELSEWGKSEAKRIGLTEKDSKELLLNVRKALNESCR